MTEPRNAEQPAPDECERLENQLRMVWEDIRMCRQFGGDPSRRGISGISLIEERDEIAKRLRSAQGSDDK